MSERFLGGSRSPSLRVPREEFEQLVERALADLPEEFAALLDNVVVVVEEEPSREDLESLDDYDPRDPDSGEIFGLYHGIALTARDTQYSGMPDRVVIYRGPLLRACASRRQVVEEVRLTVLHELGHYFGMDEDQMPF
jgi:predicted Zn-dependent protease with MMP-like domain